MERANWIIPNTTIAAAYPKTQEAEFSRAQIQNIVKAVVPKQELLDAHRPSGWRWLTSRRRCLRVANLPGRSRMHRILPPSASRASPLKEAIR